MSHKSRRVHVGLFFSVCFTAFARCVVLKNPSLCLEVAVVLHKEVAVSVIWWYHHCEAIAAYSSSFFFLLFLETSSMQQVHNNLDRFVTPAVQ